jgi:hypothetical protein
MAQAIRDELIEELLQGYSSPQDLLGEEGLFKELKKRLLERALGAELSEHLGYEKGDPAGRGGGNSRNGYSSKTVIGDDGAIEIAVPRDRNGSFEPQIVAKGQTRLDGFDDRIISLYARGLSVREIQAHLQELYGVEVSPDLISRVTDAVLEEVREWQNRPLDPVYPVIFFRVAISNRRLISADEAGVTFNWKDYRIEGPDRYKTMTLPTGEFIRRFLTHVLPKGLHRIRHYGLFANGHRAANVARARELLAVPSRPKPAETSATAAADELHVLPRPCRCCGGRMIIIETFARGCQPKHRPAPAAAPVSIDTS